MRRRYRNFQKEQKHQASQTKARDLRREYKLALQMGTNAVALLCVIFSKFAKVLLVDAFSYWFASTAFLLLTCLLSNISYALLLRDSTSKKTEKKAIISIGANS
ncbi:unnamed protein product, partial [Mesorhabditis belari]|uniref:Uncharacterized protein n=1 Tax=Mesorhabditis belari TaxID=2138241 RepID=A0AAF3ESA5_9BILA